MRQDQRELGTQPKHTEKHPGSLCLLDFVQETMQTLSNYSKQLLIHLDVNLTHQKMLQIYQNTHFILIHKCF